MSDPLYSRADTQATVGVGGLTYCWDASAVRRKSMFTRTSPASLAPMNCTVTPRGQIGLTNHRFHSVSE
jgi:hypothetical protein